MLKKRKFLLLIVAVFIFTSGFFTGIFVSRGDHQQEMETNPKPKTTKSIQKSEKQLIEEEIPKKENENVLIGYVQDFRDPRSINYQQPRNKNKDVVDFNGTTYHYNGPLTMKKKAELALEADFGGMMLWELGHDATGDQSLTNAIAEALNEDDQKEYAVNQ